MKILFDDGVNQTMFNGVVYFVKNRWYSRQYLGCGKTEKEANEDFENTIRKYHLKPREFLSQ